MGKLRVLGANHLRLLCVLVIAGRKARSYDAGSRSGSEYRSDEEDMEFYDCEEGGGAGGSGAGLGRGRSKEGFGSNGALSAELLRYYPAGGSRTADGRPQGFPVPGAHDLDSTTSARDIAVTIVEAVFVLAEFSYWRVRTLLCVLAPLSLPLEHTIVPAPCC